MWSSACAVPQYVLPFALSFLLNPSLSPFVPPALFLTITYPFYLTPSFSMSFSIPFALHYSCPAHWLFAPLLLLLLLLLACGRHCHAHLGHLNPSPHPATLSCDFYLSRCHNFIKNEMNGHCTTWHSKAFDAWHAKVRIQSIILMSIPCQVD